MRITENLVPVGADAAGAYLAALIAYPAGAEKPQITATAERDGFVLQRETTTAVVRAEPPYTLPPEAGGDRTYGTDKPGTRMD